MIISGADYNTHGVFWATLKSGQLESITEYRLPKLKEFIARFVAKPERIIHYPTGRLTPAKLAKVLSTPTVHSDWCALEGYVGFHDREGKMAAMWWKIRAEMELGKKIDNTAPLVLPPNRWKVIIGLAGNANKDAIKAHILYLYPELPANLPQDAYDAVGVARAAAMTVDTGAIFNNALRQA